MLGGARGTEGRTTGVPAERTLTRVYKPAVSTQGHLTLNISPATVRPASVTVSGHLLCNSI